MSLPDELELLRARGWTRAEAFAYCETLARSHYENFTLGSWFLPSELRPHLFAIYAFCRWADDLGDEAGSRERATTLLADWESEIDACFAARARHPVYIALTETIARYGIPPEPFHDLIAAFRLDQERTRYETFADLLDYCRFSANPVGHLFLYLYGYRDPERRLAADEICTGLQLANHLQDIARDFKTIDRVYLPREDMIRFGVDESVLAGSVATPAFRELMQFEVDRARGYFARGMQLVGMVHPRFRVEVALFALGGLAVLDAIERQNYDVLASRPVITKQRQALLLAQALARRLRP